jgi:hypothetical protein
MEIPVIAVTAGSMLGDREPLLVDATPVKPFDPDEITWLTIRMAGRRISLPRWRGA